MGIDNSEITFVSSIALRKAKIVYNFGLVPILAFLSAKGLILQDPVVQTIVSLMSLLRGQLAKCFTTYLLNTCTPIFL